MKKITKGEKGYFEQKKKQELFKTILYFAVPISLFVAGYITTKTRLNVLTIVAVLGMLPACRSLVTLIMYLKSSVIPEEDYEKIHAFVAPLTHSYDNVFTTYEKTYEVPSIVIRSGNVCGYVAKEYKKIGDLEKHLETCIRKEGYSVNVKIFDSLDNYETRLQSLNKLSETDSAKDKAILRIIFDISL
nr:hypothetical protein [Lachnospiraceae bacterium]